MTKQTHITRETVPENRRMAITEKLFGDHFPICLEPAIYSFADRLAKDYHGDCWEFYLLSNGGFYMASLSDQRFHVTCDNHFEGDLSADALGTTICLYAYSHLSFSGMPELADTCNEHYHMLREFMLQYPEVRAILVATD